MCTRMPQCFEMVLTMTKPKSHRPPIDAACGCLLSLLIEAMRRPGPGEGDRATELLMAVERQEDSFVMIPIVVGSWPSQ